MSSRSRKNDGFVRVLGVMTGTSCDALDASLLEIGEDAWTPAWSTSVSYPRALRARVLKAQRPATKLSIRDLLELHRDLGDWYGRALKKTLSSRGRSTPDLIANHGQTIAHFPGRGTSGMSLQLGDPSRIAQATGITVVSNFRDGDIAAGGQGAPLVPLFHSVLSERLSGGRGGVAFHNIGGISNLTYVGPKRQILAFDTGPGNIWIDAATERATSGKLTYDRGGKLAAQGTIDIEGVQRLLAHPYFARRPPKSTGRDDFPAKLFFERTGARGADLVATATALTVESIGRAYEREVIARRLPLRDIYLCGGGAKNDTLVSWLGDRLARHGCKVQSLAVAGLDPQLVEAQAFALFGLLSAMGQPLGGSWTGARSFGPPGHLIPGANWPVLQRRLDQLRG